MNAQIPQDSALNLIMAGNATITLKSLKTGNHFTYKVQAPKKFNPEKTPVFHVSYMYGSSNESDFVYFGTIHKQGNGWIFNAKRHKGQVTQAFEFTVNNLLKGVKMPSLEVYHEGRCCRCGRKLTTPESIVSGIGPCCASIKSKHN